MIERRKAVPTEYKGVLFDSKSEAIFARLLEVNGYDLEQKHPVRHDRHEWDFLVWVDEFGSWFSCYEGINNDNEPLGEVDSFSPPKSYTPFLIELKPSRPTDQYIKSLEERNFWCQSERRFVVWGNPFSETLLGGDVWPCVYMAREVGKHRQFLQGTEMPLYMMMNGFNERLLAVSMQYRFDLQAEHY